MVFINASMKWLHVDLLFTKNDAYDKLLAQIIRLRSHHSDYPIKSIRLDNATELTSKSFYDYYMSLGIDMKHPIPYVRTKNGLQKHTLKTLQRIARTLVMFTKLPISTCDYAIFHVAILVHLRSTAT